MSDFEEKLNAILSDPSAMAQIAGIAQSLNLGGASGAPLSDAPAPDDAPEAASTGGSLPSLDGLLGQIDPAMLQKLLPLMGELTGGGGDDERLQLLYALRPFLKPERQEKIQQAVKTARLIRVGKKLLGSLGDGHV